MNLTDSKPDTALESLPLDPALLDALLSFHGFELNAADQSAVQLHMQIISIHAKNVLSFPLAEAIEPAPIYRP